MVVVHVLYFREFLFTQHRFLPQIGNAKIGPSVCRLAVRYQKGMEMTGKTHQKIPVTFLILEEEIGNHAAPGGAVHDFRIFLICQHPVHDLLIGQVQIQKTPAFWRKRPVHGMGKGFHLQKTQPPFPAHPCLCNFSGKKNTILSFPVYLYMIPVRDSMDECFYPVFFHQK